MEESSRAVTAACTRSGTTSTTVPVAATAFRCRENKLLQVQNTSKLSPHTKLRLHALYTSVNFWSAAEECLLGFIDGCCGRQPESLLHLGSLALAVGRLRYAACSCYGMRMNMLYTLRGNVDNS